MRIQDLPVGSEITLEVDQGDSKFGVKLKILGSSPDGIYLQPIMVKGKVLDVGLRQFHKWVYNIYAFYGENKQRIGWKNVQLELVRNADGSCMYQARTYTFATNSIVSERRNNIRFMVDAHGIAKSGELEIPVAINDVSANGVSFWVPKEVTFPESRFFLRFFDDVHGEYSEMELFCTVARRVEKESKTLMGCRIDKCNDAYISYIRIKLIKNEERKNEDH